MSNPLSTTLQGLRIGNADVEAGAALAEVIEQVKLLKKSGTVTIKLSVDLVDAEGATPRVFITDEITAKPPKAAAPSTLFFVDEQNNPTRTDPQQKVFDRSFKTPLPGSIVMPTTGKPDGGPALKSP